MKAGEVIRTLRVELDLSLREVARSCAMSHVHLGEIERGVAAADDEMVAILCATMARLVEPRAKQRASAFRKQMEAVVKR